MRIKGGLGNQLFQYATAYALAKRLNQPLEFDIGFTSNMTVRTYKLSELNVKEANIVKKKFFSKKIIILKNKYINKVCRMLNFSKHKLRKGIYLLETREVYLPDIFSIKADNIYMDGYFQTPKYFEQYKDDLLRQFTPKYNAESSYLEALDKIRRCNSVAVHVRRGDFKKDYNKFHYVLDREYYRQAIIYIRSCVKNPVFFWFSDDIEWVKEAVGNMDDFQFIKLDTPHEDIDELMLMKNCNHIIVANSTFSWWAAWLNENDDTVVIVPDKPYGMDEMIPKNWIKIKA